MATPDELKGAIETYIERFSAGDSVSWAACFAEDATHEDPVGTERHHGHAAIQASYEQSLAIGRPHHVPACVLADRDRPSRSRVTTAGATGRRHRTDGGRPVPCRPVRRHAHGER